MPKKPLKFKTKMIESIRQMKLDYVEMKDSAGGYRAEWLTELESHVRENVEEFVPALVELSLKVGGDIWEEDPPMTAPDQRSFVGDGFHFPSILTFPDKDCPSKFRKIDSRFATCRQARENYILKIRIGARTSAVGEAGVAAVEALVERAGGDYETQLVSVLDREDHGTVLI